MNQFCNFDLSIKGQSTLKAFEKGAIPGLLSKGYCLYDAMILANRAGKMRFENTVDNLVVTAGKLLVADYLIGDGLSLNGLTWHAIGTGTTTPSVSDVALTTEYARKVLTTKSRSGVVITLSVFYLASACTVFVKEAGIFGEAASATPGSGTLFSHFLQSYDNSAAANDLTFEYNVTVN